MLKLDQTFIQKMVNEKQIFYSEIENVQGISMHKKFHLKIVSSI